MNAENEILKNFKKETQEIENMNTELSKVFIYFMWIFIYIVYKKYKFW